MNRPPAGEISCPPTGKSRCPLTQKFKGLRIHQVALRDTEGAVTTQPDLLFLPSRWNELCDIHLDSPWSRALVWLIHDPTPWLDVLSAMRANKEMVAPTDPAASEFRRIQPVEW